MLALCLVAFVIAGTLLLGIGFLGQNILLISAGIYMQIFNIFLFLSLRHAGSGREKEEAK